MVKKIKPFVTIKPFINIKNTPIGDWDKDGIPNVFDCAPKNPKKKGFYLLIKEGPATRWRYNGHFKTFKEAEDNFNKHFKGGLTKGKVLNDKQYAKWRTGKIESAEFKAKAKTAVKTWVKESKESFKENVKTDIKGMRKDVGDWRKRSAKKWSKPLKKEYPSPVFGFDDVNLTGGFTLQRPARVNPVKKRRVKYKVKKVTVVSPRIIKVRVKPKSIDEQAIQREKEYFAEQLRGFRIQHEIDKKEYVEEPEKEKDVETIAKEMLGEKLRKKYNV